MPVYHFPSFTIHLPLYPFAFSFEAETQDLTIPAIDCLPDPDSAHIHVDALASISMKSTHVTA